MSLMKVAFSGLSGTTRAAVPGDPENHMIRRGLSLGKPYPPFKINTGRKHILSVEFCALGSHPLQLVHNI